MLAETEFLREGLVLREGQAQSADIIPNPGEAQALLGGLKMSRPPCIHLWDPGG